MAYPPDKRRDVAARTISSLAARLRTESNPTVRRSLSLALTEAQKQSNLLNEATITPAPAGAEPAPEQIDWASRAPEFDQPSSGGDAGLPDPATIRISGQGRAPEASPDATPRQSDVLIGKLIDALSQPGESVAKPRDLSIGDRLTLALASTRPDTMANVVKPLLDERRTYADRAAAVREKQRQDQIDNTRAAIGPVQAQETLDLERQKESNNLLRGFTNLSRELGVGQERGLIASLKETAQAAHAAGMEAEANRLIDQASTLQNIREYDSDHRAALGMDPLPATQADLDWFNSRTQEAKASIQTTQARLQQLRMFDKATGRMVDKRQTPTPILTEKRTKLQTTMSMLAEAKGLALEGYGGPVESIGRGIQGMFGGASSEGYQKFKRLAILLQLVRPTFTKEQYGTALSPTERSLIEDVLAGTETRSEQIVQAIEGFEQYFKPLLDSYNATYKFPDTINGPVSPEVKLPPGATEYGMGLAFDPFDPAFAGGM